MTKKNISLKIVISKNIRNGRVISLYGDDLWDLTIYRNKERGSSKINFTNWCEDSSQHVAIVREMKYLHYLLLTESVGGRQSVLTVTTVCGAYQVLIKKLAKYSVTKNIHISDVLQSVVEIKRFSGIKEYKTSSVELGSLLSKLIEMGKEVTGLNILGGSYISQLRGYRSREKKSQTEFIPQRLLSEFIDHWQFGLREFESHWVEISQFLDSYFDCPGSGLTVKQQGFKYGYKKGFYMPEFKSLSEKCNLVDYFKKFGISDVKKLSSHLVYIQSIGKSMIHVYSGMRFDEANSLKVHALIKEKVTSELQRWILRGETTKFTGKKTKTVWVTSHEIQATWDVLTKISNYVAKRVDVLGEQPLFISIAYLGLAGGKPSSEHVIKCTNLIGIDPLQYIGETALIVESDFKILTEIDPHRDWDNSDFTIGAKWILRSHQFRRTIAILAAQSGLVSMPSLRRQLQHLTEEMTFYYSEGSSRLHKGDDASHNEFAELIRESSAEASAFAYIANYLLTTADVLSEHSLMKDERSMLIRQSGQLLKDDRKIYRKKFEAGEMSYKETVVGACTKNGPCIDRAHRSLTTCLSCPSGIIKLTKLDRLIENQEKFKKNLNPNKLEWLVADRELKDMTDFRKKAIEK